MKRSASPTVLLVALCVLAGAMRPAPTRAADIDPAVLAPDTTLIFLQIHDVTRLEESWKEQGLYQLWNEPQMQRYTKPIRDRIDYEMKKTAPSQAPAGQGDRSSAPADPRATLIQKIGSLSWKEFKALFPGAFATFIADAEFIDGGGYAFDWVFAGKAGKKREDYDRIIEIVSPAMPANPKGESFEVEGVTVYQRRYPMQDADGVLPPGARVSPETMERVKHTTIQVAMVDDWVLVADGGRDTLRKVILRLKGKRSDTLSSDARFRNAMGRADKAERARLFVNLDRIMEGVIKGVKSASDLAARIGGGAAEPVFNVDALALDDLQGFGYCLAMDKKGMRARAALTMRALPRGVGRVFDAFRGAVPFKTARLAPENAVYFEAFNFDIPQFYQTIDSLARKAYPPAAPQIDQALMTVREQIGFDIVADIINNLGGEFGLFYPPADPNAGPVAMPNQVLVIECRDGVRLRQVFDEAEKKMMAQATTPNTPAPESLFERSQYLGYDVFTVRAPQGAVMMTSPQFAWVFTENWVIFANRPGDLKDALRRMTGREQRGLDGSANFKKARSLFPGAVAGFSMTDMSTQMAALCRQLPMLNFMITMTSGGKVPPNLLDMTAIPDPTVFERHLGLSVSVSKTTRNDIVMEGVLLNP